MGESYTEGVAHHGGPESDTRLSTVARYAAAVGVRLHWSQQPVERTA